MEQQTLEQKSEKPGDFNNHRVPLVLSVLPVGTEQQSDSSAKTSISARGAAESAAVDGDLGIVINAWPALDPRYRSIIVGIVVMAIGSGVSAHL